MTDPSFAPPSRLGPALLLTLSILGLLVMPVLMFGLALSTAQSYAIPGARTSALSIAVFSAVVLVVEVVTWARRRRRLQSIVAVSVATVITTFTTVAWVLFWLFALRTITTFS